MKVRLGSIRQKLQAIVFLGTLVALLCALIGNISGDILAFHRSLKADMATQAELLGRMTTPAMTFDDPKLAADNLKLFEIRSNIHAAAIYDDHGKIFASYVAAGQKKDFPRLPDVDDVRVENGELVVFKRIVSEGHVLGTVYLCADYDLTGTIAQDAGIALVVGIFAMAIAFLLIARLGRLVIEPISAVAQTARQVVEQRDYSRRVEKASSDEVGVLVESFNDMLNEVERRTRELEASYREIAREAEERKLAKQEVMRLNADLEQRVHERTAELKESNKALEMAKAAAEDASQAKSAFLSSMSHELRTPLNAVLGFAQLLASDTHTPTDQQRKEFTGYILKAGKHLLTLINEILDLAKVESGEMTLSLEPVALAEVIQECQAMIEPLGQQRGLHMTFPKGAGYTVLADRTRLKQVLLNLLSNAVKYNRPSGSLAVACEPSIDGGLCISVQDTGAGLSAAQMDGLFQPFNRLGQETSAEEGTGIGLVLTKRLVELMGGSIAATSTVGVGSVFWVELKLTDSASLQTGINVAADANVAGNVTGLEEAPRSTLLYVEDNPANLKLIQAIVDSRPDLRLLAAPDAHLGIQLARAHLPDLILMDIHLPGMSGIEALKVLRADPATAGIPVIAVTANAMPRDVEAGLNSGFFRYVTKPIDVAEFMDAIDNALEAAAKQHVQNPSQEGVS